MFIDRVKLQCLAGKGGNGVVAWRREKYIPKGGPSGGNGGPGGSIILQADHNIPHLEEFKHTRLLKAPSGGAGGPNQRQGKTGEDKLIKVPCGTFVKDGVTGELIADLTRDGQRLVLCRGGRGGRGNASFRSSTNRAPAIAKAGDPGEERQIELELKLIADVGLIGFPNAGKSTLISRLSAAKVSIAPYPFTTLHPNLGFMEAEDGTRLLLADIPGIIEGAHLDRGLGLEFLRHIERTKALVYVVDLAGCDGREPADDLRVIREELEKYEPELLQRPCVIVLNKCDLEAAQEQYETFIRQWPQYEAQMLCVSAERGDGLEALRDALMRLVEQATRAP